MVLQMARTIVLELQIQNNSIQMGICTAMLVMMTTMAIQSEMIGTIARQGRPAGLHRRIQTMTAMVVGMHLRIQMMMKTVYSTTTMNAQKGQQVGLLQSRTTKIKTDVKMSIAMVMAMLISQTSALESMMTNQIWMGMEQVMLVKMIPMAMVSSTNTMNAQPIHLTGLVSMISTTTKMAVETRIEMQMTTVTTSWICQMIAPEVK